MKTAERQKSEKQWDDL